MITLPAFAFALWLQALPQGLLWQRLAGTPGNDAGQAVAVDREGNVYAAGTVSGDLHGRKGLGGGDVALIKYSGSGQRIWTRILGSRREDWVAGAAVDGSGHVYLTGSFRETMDGHASLGKGDVFLAKFDGSGKPLWTRTLGGPGEDAASGLGIGAGGNLYIGGITEGGLDGQPHAGGRNFFLWKCDLDGKRLWSRSFGSDSDEREPYLSLDGEENVYLAGSTDGAIEGFQNAGFYDILVVKYDRTGNRQWASQFGGASSDEVQGIVVDRKGHPYLAMRPIEGYEKKPYGLFLTKLGLDGKMLWSRPLADNANGQAMAVDASGDILVAGSYAGDEPLEGQAVAGTDDFLLAKYDGEAGRRWARVWGTPAWNRIGAMALDRDGLIHLAGQTHDGIPGLQGAGGADLYVAKFTPFSPSFDCSRAGSLQENLICRSAELSSLDDSLARLFADMRDASPVPEEARAEQKHWLKAKRNVCRNAAELGICMRERAEILKSRRAGRKK